jgi:protein-arginine kinase activator protein McsA
MNCVFCERPARYEARAGLQRLRLCVSCARSWARRERNAPIISWLQQMKPSQRLHTECPFCGCTAARVRETGLYGCALCYLFLSESATP